MKDNVKQLTPKEVIYTAPDDIKKRVELTGDFMPVTRAILEKYGKDDFVNVRQIENRKTIAELNVKNTEAAFIEAELNCENPVFYFGMADTYVMAVTNMATTGSHVVLKKEDLTRAQRRKIERSKK
jgi:hypothetical protein